MDVAAITGLVTAVAALVAAIGALRHSANTRKRAGQRPTGQNGAHP
jgi:hypothetical protein